ncbi:AMP-binding protein [Microbacterium sp. Root53]|uniref:AMP-binding protein n=1 Tax=Microbacterium sp. Root53 TaxID=1736553 RepID=UPI0009E7DC88|nr:AMP-binding protein [Microbacterium sp. Root53]
MPSTDVRPGLSLLSGHPDAPALIADGRAVTYGELDGLVRARVRALGPTRRLVMIAARNAVEPIVTYLAALEGGHPVLMVSGGQDETSLRHRAALVERFDPDVIATDGVDGWRLEEVRAGTRHELHRELAMLASTSGSTGSPKLVRLSAENLASNAAAIAEYLRLEPRDRAATTLPLQYCYGLSVVNSHLLAGGSLLLTERSVSDPRFWDDAAAHGITSFAGVPYTFELLEAGGFADRDLPHLRYLTQAGGRLDPAAVRRFAALGARKGFELFVMYGQTEATARMAYLPPELAETCAGAIGRPIPGGAFRLDPLDGGDPVAEGDSGELVYQGPNVMLGYAETPADFALGRTVHELRTGDLARRRPDGLYEITGRLNRFVKIFGLRIDLDRLERLLAEEGITARAAGADERLLVFATSDRAAARARDRAAALTGVPAHAIAAHVVAEFPRTANGKPDNAALVRIAEEQDRAARAVAAVAGGDGAVTPQSVRDLLALLLDRPDAGIDDSFAGLGGDSLSYVEVSLRLEAMLGALPRDWPTRSARGLAELAAPRAAQDETARPAARARRSRLAHVETPAVLRALAIVLIVGTHADLFSLKGGAHLLLAVAGYNIARFALTDAPGVTRVRRLIRGMSQLAVPAVLWIGAVALMTGFYLPTTALLVNNLVPGDGRWNEQWQFWFLEAMLWGMAGLALLLGVRAIDRLERRMPFAFPLALLGAALAARLTLTGLHAEHVERYAAASVAWLIVLGWLVARADTTSRRVLVSALTAVTVFGFFGDPAREAIVAGGILLLVWLPAIPLPQALSPAVGTLAGSSLFVYLTHWQVYPPFEQSAPWLGTLLSFAVGIVAWQAYTRASSAGAAALRRVRTLRRTGRRVAAPTAAQTAVVEPAAAGTEAAAETAPSPA